MADLARTHANSRAAQLDRRGDRGPLTEYLCFAMGDRLYATPIGIIREILNPQPITPVPRAPPFVLGIMSVRGQLITVLDLRRRLNLSESPETQYSRILLLETGLETLGVYVDSVLQVCRLAEDDIEDAAPVLGTEVSEHITGIARSQNISSSLPGGRTSDGTSSSEDEPSAAATVIIVIDLVAALT